MRLINTMKEFFSLTAAKEWWARARQLSAGDRWRAPISLWSFAVFLAIVNIWFGQQPSLLWLGAFNLIGIGAWGVIALSAASTTTIRSASNFRRLGLLGPTRPRWWFEVATLCVYAVAITSAVLILAALLQSPRQQFPASLFSILMVSARMATLGFLVTATVGYLVSFITRRPRSGRAFDCAHFYYAFFVPLSMLMYSAMQAPPQLLFPVGVIAAILGVLGVAGLFSGILSIGRRFELRERCRESAGSHS